MASVPFNPSRIFVDTCVETLPLTQRIVKKFPGISVEMIEDSKCLKKPAEMTWAKKGLLLTRMKADPIKEFKAMSDSICRAERPFAPTRKYYSLDLISNCHIECTYCILQSYLENNPVITIFTNIEEILERLKQQIQSLPERSIIGTGKIADSLALDEISEHTKYLVPFFAGLSSTARLELKTKSDHIDNLLDLDHGGRTVVSWSMNPEKIIEREEYKTASFEARLKAAKRVAEAGYSVGFHFDPVILHDGWQENYAQAFDRIFKIISSDQIAWMSLGTLRFPARQARIMKKRFPKNESVLDRLVSTNRTFLHYPDDLREEVQSYLEERVSSYLPSEKIYRCMDS